MFTTLLIIKAIASLVLMYGGVSFVQHGFELRNGTSEKAMPPTAWLYDAEVPLSIMGGAFTFALGMTTMIVACMRL